MEQQYDEKPDLTVICKVDPIFLTNGGGLPFAVMPTPEEIAQEWAEQDPSLHYFFAVISTDIPDLMSVEDYKDMKAADQEAAAAAEEAEGEEVDATA